VIEVLREALGGERAWLVGGALRDRLLGRPTPDLDVVVDGDVRGAARRLGRGLGGASFELSDQFGAWRIVARDRGWQVDLTPLQGGSLEADLGARDLTVNAMAEPLSGGELVDPFGGARDLAERRLRMVSPAAFAADPLRTIRVARLATELRFEVEPATADAVRAHAAELRDVSPERVFAELRRIVAADDAVDGVILVDELGLTASVLPELTELRGVG
jgi:poly(A) polymerase